MGKPNLKVHLAKASTSEPASHVANSRKGKASLSQIMIKNKTACYKCGCYNHVAKKCRTPKHLVDLYMKSADRAQDDQKFEAHFTSLEMEMGTSDQVPHGT